VLSTYVSAGKILNLGIANVSSKVLSALLTANVSQRPSVVQNRFYPQTQFEVSLRNLCRRHGIIFQSFWTLTGNLGEGQLMQSEVVRRLADDISVSRAVALYALVIGLDGVSVLDGTTNEGHMAEDIDGLKMIEEWAGGNGKDKWEVLTAQFRVLINDI
jgi:diketogulonate reductase-like aldo/keto reductase